MANFEFGNVSVDMRQEYDYYGVPAMQAFDAFLSNFVPVSDEIVVADPTRFVYRLYDAAGQFVTLTTKGNLQTGQANRVSVEAAGVRQTLFGNFSADGFGAVSGTVDRMLSVLVQDGSLLADFSGLGISFEDPSPSDADLLSGADTVTAGSGDDYLLGYAGGDFISGGSGNDTLDGGTGSDTMAGGLANDSYVVDAAGDVVTENANQGTDTVRSSVTHTLGLYFENLALRGADAIDGTGNAAANAISGNGANNLLAGLVGADALDGGKGTDTLLGGGRDDVLDGGAGRDSLDGGSGADLMRGGTGGDAYRVNVAGDVVMESANQGTDTILSSITYALGAHVEDLTLTGSKNIGGTGNAVANAIIGNEAGNLLSGLVGADTLAGGGGADTLTGGAGQDAFEFNAPLSATTNVDRIMDFNVVDDLIGLDDDVFTAIALGMLDAGAFRSGSGATTAQDADDRVIYNTATGRLFYDADGAGGADAALFAALNGTPAITAADFLIVA